MKKDQKIDFYKNKKAIKRDDIGGNKILFFKEEPYDTNKSSKYFVGYNDNDDIRPLYIMLPQMIDYAKCFESNNVL